MLYCNLQVLLCTEIAVQKDFAPQNMTSRVTIACHIYAPPPS